MTLPTAVDTFRFVLGTWSVERSLEDRRTGTCGSFVGSATVVEVTDGRARYAEEGELCLGAHRGLARRRLLYARRDAASVMAYFADGRPFVDLDLRTGVWRSVHDCGADRYEITTVVREAGVMQERWRVRGPDKDYDAATTLTRR